MAIERVMNELLPVSLPIPSLTPFYLHLPRETPTSFVNLTLHTSCPTTCILTYLSTIIMKIFPSDTNRHHQQRSRRQAAATTTTTTSTTTSSTTTTEDTITKEELMNLSTDGIIQDNNWIERLTFTTFYPYFWLSVWDHFSFPSLVHFSQQWSLQEDWEDVVQREAPGKTWMGKPRKENNLILCCPTKSTTFGILLRNPLVSLQTGIPSTLRLRHDSTTKNFL